MLELFQALSYDQLIELEKLVSYVEVPGENAVEVAARAVVMLIKAGVDYESKARRAPVRRSPETHRLAAESKKMSELLTRLTEGEPLTADEAAFMHWCKGEDDEPIDEPIDEPSDDDEPNDDDPKRG